MFGTGFGTVLLYLCWRLQPRIDKRIWKSINIFTQRVFTILSSPFQKYFGIFSVVLLAVAAESVIFVRKPIPEALEHFARNMGSSNSIVEVALQSVFDLISRSDLEDRDAVQRLYKAFRQAVFEEDPLERLSNQISGVASDSIPTLITKLNRILSTVVAIQMTEITRPKIEVIMKNSLIDGASCITNAAMEVRHAVLLNAGIADKTYEEVNEAKYVCILCV